MALANFMKYQSVNDYRVTIDNALIYNYSPSDDKRKYPMFTKHLMNLSSLFNFHNLVQFKIDSDFFILN